MLKALDRWRLWLGANLCGIAVFTALAARTWIEPELADVPGASVGEFIVWGATAFPVFLLFMAAHLVMGFGAYRELSERESWRGTGVLMLTLCLWIAAFFFDNAHHGV